MLNLILERIDERLDALGLAESRAAKEAGLSSSAIRDMRRAVAAGKRDAGVSTRTLAALAPILQTSPEWLLTGRGPDDVDREVPVIGYVGAGAAAHFYAVSQCPSRNNLIAPLPGARPSEL